MTEPSRFAGILYPDSLQVDDLVHPMLNSMKRGIKGLSEVHTYKNLQIGTIGSKVGFNEKKMTVAVLDGTIENLSALVKELKGMGFPASVKKPEEMIIYAYLAWDESFIERLEGSFAFAIYDKASQKLLLARDRIGKKPLYWYHDQKHFIFASELKALLATGIVPQTPSENALASYLYFGFIPQDVTPITNVNKLLPAYYLVFQPDRGKHISPYCSYSSYFGKKQNPQKEKVTSNISFYLRDSTKHLIPPHAPVGCFILGGLGSMTVAQQLTYQIPSEQIKGYTCGFYNKNEDDIDAALRVSNKLQIELFKSMVDPEHLMDNLVEIIWNLDEPIADPFMVPLWNTCELASHSVQTIFSGMGSDEFLAGHNRYTSPEHTASFLNRLISRSDPFLKRLLAPISRLMYKPLVYNFLKHSHSNPWQFEFLRNNAIFDENKIQEVSPKLKAAFDTDTFLHKFHKIGGIQSTTSSLLYFDVKTRLPDHFMLEFDRITKAHGLKWEAPFLNHHLVEYAAGLPEPNVLSEKETASYLKLLLKDTFDPYLIDRPKKSRPHFLDSWTQNPAINPYFQLLSKGTLIETGLISESWLKGRLLNPHSDHFLPLWSILVLEIWFHLFINHPVRSSPPTLDLKELLT